MVFQFPGGSCKVLGDSFAMQMGNRLGSARYYAAATPTLSRKAATTMRHQLLNLRHVPDDEAQEVRELLDANQIPWYETEPNRWGISAGAIWIADDKDALKAGELMAGYQTERKIRARAEQEAARLEGTVETFWSQARRQPMRLIMILFGIAIFVALSLWPLLLAAT